MSFPILANLFRVAALSVEFKKLADTKRAVRTMQA